MGMTVDTARNLLWAATSAVAEGGHTDSADIGHAAVVALDLATGTRRGWYPAPEDGHAHWLGDLTLAPNGEVITSDSRTPAVYRLRSLDGTLEPVPLHGRLVSPQGLATSPNGRVLYLSDYSLGVVRIDLGTGAMTVLPYPDDATLLGVDGLYRHGRTLIGIQNGVAPHRVVAMTLNEDGTRIRRVTVLEANHPLFVEPTLGTLSGDTLFYVANSEWERFSNSSAADSASEPRVLRLVLHRAP
jgi:sugar lactone lactonase YvrE